MLCRISRFNRLAGRRMVGDGEQLRTEEAAAVLKVSKSTVINYAKSGLIRATRTVGKHRRYLAESVAELAAVLAMPEGPEQDAAIESLRRRNRGEPEPDAPA